MASKRRPAAFRLPALLALVFLACSPAPRFYLRYGAELAETDLERLLRENPLGAGENIKITTLGAMNQVSHHIVQVRDRERPHIHKDHDATVVMLRGKGYLMLDRKRVEIAPGDVLLIPRAVPHYFVNTHGEPSVALAVFAPPFDGKDTIPVAGP